MLEFCRICKFSAVRIMNAYCTPSDLEHSPMYIHVGLLNIYVITGRFCMFCIENVGKYKDRPYGVWIFYK